MHLERTGYECYLRNSVATNIECMSCSANKLAGSAQGISLTQCNCPLVIALANGKMWSCIYIYGAKIMTIPHSNYFFLESFIILFHDAYMHLQSFYEDPEGGNLTLSILDSRLVFLIEYLCQAGFDDYEFFVQEYTFPSDLYYIMATRWVQHWLQTVLASFISLVFNFISFKQFLLEVLNVENLVAKEDGLFEFEIIPIIVQWQILGVMIIFCLTKFRHGSIFFGALYVTVAYFGNRFTKYFGLYEEIIVYFYSYIGGTLVAIRFTNVEEEELQFKNIVTKREASSNKLVNSVDKLFVNIDLWLIVIIVVKCYIVSQGEGIERYNINSLLLLSVIQMCELYLLNYKEANLVKLYKENYYLKKYINENVITNIITQECVFCYLQEATKGVELGPFNEIIQITFIFGIVATTVLCGNILDYLLSGMRENMFSSLLLHHQKIKQEKIADLYRKELLVREGSYEE